MKFELKHFEPLRAANIAALVYGVMMAVLALIFTPFMLIGALAAPDGAGFAGGIFAMFFIVFYPLIGLVMGWISGFLSCVVYNFIVRWTGGLLVECETDAVAPAPHATPPAMPS